MDNNSGWKIKKLTPQEYHDDLIRLASLIPDNKYEFVYGIPRGGLVPATYIAYSNKNIDILVEYNLNIPKEKVLVVDDVADTGETLDLFKGYDTATIYYKKRSIVVPTYWVKDVSNYWIIFPYENESEPINRNLE